MDYIHWLVGEVCGSATEPDGIDFDRSSLVVNRIKEDADYEGVRVRFHATLAKARIPMQVDNTVRSTRRRVVDTIDSWHLSMTG